MKTIHSDMAPKAIGPYVQAKQSGGFLFLSGQIAINPSSAKIEAQTVSEQTEQVCKNIGNVLSAAGLSFDSVVKTTCFLTDISAFADFNAVYQKYFTGKPARSCVEVRALPAGALCEIEVIAESAS